MNGYDDRARQLTCHTRAFQIHYIIYATIITSLIITKSNVNRELRIHIRKNGWLD